MMSFRNLYLLDINWPHRIVTVYTYLLTYLLTYLCDR